MVGCEDRLPSDGESDSLGSADAEGDALFSDDSTTSSDQESDERRHPDNQPFDMIEPETADMGLPPDDGGETAEDAAPLPEMMRFAIEVSNDVPESIWVQLSSGDGQIGWVTVTGEDGRIYFIERCDIPQCDVPEGVCGQGIGMVRDITGGTYSGSIEMYWDGVTSIVEEEDDCEQRVQAPAGSYTASFCWSLNATINSEDDPALGVPGELVDPICQDIEFELYVDDEVVYQIMGG